MMLSLINICKNKCINIYDNLYNMLIRNIFTINDNLIQVPYRINGQTFLATIKIDDTKSYNLQKILNNQYNKGLSNTYIPDIPDISVTNEKKENINNENNENKSGTHPLFIDAYIILHDDKVINVMDHLEKIISPDELYKEYINHIKVKHVLPEYYHNYMKQLVLITADMDEYILINIDNKLFAQ
jgi:hypothetical protein